MNGLKDLTVGSKVVVRIGRDAKFNSEIIGITNEHFIVMCNGARRFKKESGIIDRLGDVKIRYDIIISPL